MTKIAYFSDIHIDTHNPVDGMEIFQKLEACRDADIIINAGDNQNGHSGDFGMFIENIIEDMGKPYIRVMGNHDFYHESDWENPLYNGITEVNGLKIAFATLWTDCHDNPMAEWQFQKYMADASLIEGFSIAKMKALHQSQKKLVLESKADIVVTHNPPSLLSVGSQFKGDTIGNMMFIPNMENEVLDCGAKVWIHGHVHSYHDYMLGDTRVVANPLGYPHERRVPKWKVRFIEI